MKRIIKLTAAVSTAVIIVSGLCACQKKDNTSGDEEVSEVYTVSEESEASKTLSEPGEKSGSQNSGKGLFSLKEAVEAAGGLEAFTKDITVPDYDDSILIKYALASDDQLEITMVLKEMINPADEEVQKLFREEFDKMRPHWAEQIRAAEAKNVRPYTIVIKFLNTDDTILYETVISDDN